VSFLTVKPGLKFLIALSGPKEWTDLALELLKKALILWGVGGKTSSGYGRFHEKLSSVGRQGDKPAQTSPVCTEFLAWINGLEPELKAQK